MAATTHPDPHVPDTGSWSRAPPGSFLTLSAGQEAALRAYLDSGLLGLERDERKHRLAPLSSLLERLSPLLNAILQIPANEPWASTRIAYLLNFTASMARYITSLPLMTLPADANENDAEACATIEQQAGDTMQAVLDLLRAVERGWVAVLCGQGWVAPEEGTEGTVVPVQGGSGVDQTSRVRLRSIVDLAKEKVLAWARPYGDFGGEAMGPDGDEGTVDTEEERNGWEHQIVGMWRGILDELDKQTPPEVEEL